MEIVKFKKSLFGGFRRKDVLQFIEEFSEEKTDEIHGLTEQVAALQKKLDETQAELQTRSGECDEIKKQQEALRAVNENQAKQISALEENTSKITAESKASLQLLKERDVKIAFLEDKSQKLMIKLQACESKSRKYDELSVEIGEMLLEAKQSAEVIIRQAEHRSADMTAQTDAAVDSLSADLNCFLQQLGQIKTSLHDMMGNVGSQIQTIETSLYTAKNNIQTFQSKKPASKPTLRTELSAEPAPETEKAAETQPQTQPAQSEKQPEIAAFTKAAAGQDDKDAWEHRHDRNFFR